MPLYNLYCPHCSYSMTNWIQHTEFIKLCPRCDTKMKTQIAAAELRFKGEWESNDHKPVKEKE